MKFVYLLTLIAALSFTTGPCLAAGNEFDIRPEHRVSCEELLDLVERVRLPGTEVGVRYASGVSFGPPSEEQIAEFFRVLRTIEDHEKVVGDLAWATTQDRVAYLHGLALPFARTATHVMDLMNGDQTRFEGQSDDHILRIMSNRSLFIDQYILPLIFERPMELVPRYFEELVAIAADFANVPLAYHLAVDLIDRLEPHRWIYAAHASNLDASDLGRVKFHALANQMLEDPELDPLTIRETARRVSDQLEVRHPVAQLRWLLPQLAYWIQLGQTVRETALFGRAGWLTGELISLLPDDLSAAGDQYPQARLDVLNLIRALGRVPGFVTPAQAARLSALVIRH